MNKTSYSLTSKLKIRFSVALNKHSRNIVINSECLIFISINIYFLYIHDNILSRFNFTLKSIN